MALQGLLRRRLAHIGALAGFAGISLLYTWPLACRFSTHFLGVRGGDTGIIIWDMWYFRHALTVLKTNPLWTDMMYWPYGGNLVLTNYTLFNDALNFFLMPALGLAASWNLIFVLSSVLAGYGVFLLLRDWDYTADVAFVAGALFAFCPALTLQIEWWRGLEYACVNALPFFLWTLSRAVRDRKLRDMALAALCLTWVWTYNYYHFISCVMLVPLFYLWWERPLRLELKRAHHPSLARALDAAALGAFAWVVWALATNGQREFHGAGSAREILEYVAPYLCFWGLLGLRLLVAFSPRLRRDGGAIRWRALSPYAGVLGLWTFLNIPMIAAVLYFIATGDYGTAPRAWRGGGDPVDVLWLVAPNLFHPLWRGWLYGAVKGSPFGAPNMASLGLLPMAAGLWLWLRRPADRWVSLWFAGFALCAALTLGPWLKVLGVHTYLPLPFYFLHLLPVFNNMANGSSFGVFAMLFLALLFAAALKELMSRLPRSQARWAPVLALGLLAFEFAPGSRPSHRLEFPAWAHRLGARPSGAMLPVPFGAHFPRIVQGIWGVDWLGLTSQMVHQKPIVGGFLPRVAGRVHRAMTADPFLQALVAAQSGGGVEPIMKDRFRVSRWFGEMRLRYVIVETSLAPQALRKAMEGWPMRLIDQEGTVRLYETVPSSGTGGFRPSET